MENTFFNVNDAKQLITAAKKNNVEITISWYEDHSFITISPLMELNAVDDSGAQQEEKIDTNKQKCVNSANTDPMSWRIREHIGAISFDSKEEALLILSNMKRICRIHGYARVIDFLRYAELVTEDLEQMVGESIFSCTETDFDHCVISQHGLKNWHIVGVTLPGIVYIPPEKKPSGQSVIDKVLDGMCAVEFVNEQQAKYVLEYMHYILHTNDTVCSDDFFDYLEKAYNGNEWVMWHSDECGKENGDFLNVKLVKCSNGRYKLDKSTIPQPSPVPWM